MGNALSIKFNVTLYKWSSAEFPQEYTVLYTHDSHELLKYEGSSVFLVSVNQDKVLCRFSDCFNNSPVRFHLAVTTQRDTTGNRMFGEIKVVSDGTSQQHRLKDAIAFFYGKNIDRPSGWYEVERKDQTTWEVRHLYAVGLRTSIKCTVKIRCDQVGGLSVDFNGPCKYKGLPLFSEELIGPYIKREVKGDPPRAVKAIVETEFIGEALTLFPKGKEDTTSFQVSVNSTGLINNIGGKNQGDYNGSVLYNCEVYQ